MPRPRPGCLIAGVADTEVCGGRPGRSARGDPSDTAEVCASKSGGAAKSLSACPARPVDAPQIGTGDRRRPPRRHAGRAVAATNQTSTAARPVATAPRTPSRTRTEPSRCGLRSGAPTRLRRIPADADHDPNGPDTGGVPVTRPEAAGPAAIKHRAQPAENPQREGARTYAMAIAVRAYPASSTSARVKQQGTGHGFHSCTFHDSASLANRSARCVRTLSSRGATGPARSRTVLRAAEITQTTAGGRRTRPLGYRVMDDSMPCRRVHECARRQGLGTSRDPRPDRDASPPADDRRDHESARRQEELGQGGDDVDAAARARSPLGLLEPAVTDRASSDPGHLPEGDLAACERMSCARSMRRTSSPATGLARTDEHADSRPPSRGQERL